MKKNRNSKGITLIALVVTIIVLMILAGVSVSMLTGQNGILNRAAEAKEKTDSSSDLEELQIKAYEALTNYYVSGSNESESEYILKKLNGAGIVADEKTGTVTYKGKTYDISDIMGKTGEQKAIAAQTDVKLKQITKATATEAADIALFNTGKIRMIIQEENDATNRAVIPNGFYYVTGAPSTGLVVSDKFDDDDNNSKGGNQFVWVPCSGTAGRTYEKKNGLAATWKNNYSGYQYCYTNYTDWEDNGGNTTSVDTYGGFYIARYEAGLPQNSALWERKNNATYGWTNGELAGSLSGDRNTNILGMKPVSKKNNASWNRISQENALDVSSKMYEDSTSVTSSLVDSYAWDTVVEWIKSRGESVTNSTSYGNYVNSTFSLSNVLYAVHKLNYANWSWTEYASKYILGDLEITSRSQSGEQTLYELATGTTTETKRNNIYDMAGNMWEWTTETGKYGNSASTTTWAVLRGGSFIYYGSNYPVSYRHGGVEATWGGDINVGFRVVLYIQ